MIKCGICGFETKSNLARHIKIQHKLSSIEYKEQYGEISSDEYKKNISDKLTDRWKDDDCRKKMMDSRSWIYSDSELNERRINSIKNFYKEGGKIWNDGLTKETDERLVSIGEFNKKNLLGRTKEKYDYLQKHSDLMISLWKNSNLKKKREEIHNDPIQNKNYKEKISNTLTNKILNGEINNFSNFNSGWYENLNGRHWYSSGLELDSMIFMDNFQICWSKNSKIKIKYIKDDVEHYYIPDFLLKINNIEYVIEMKGFDWDGDTKLKSEYAKKEYDNYYIFYSVKELKFFLENIK